MQVAHEVRHVVVEELLVGADGVAGEQRAHAFRSEAQHIIGDLLLSFFEAQSMPPFVDQTRTGVHVAHEVVHMVHSLLTRLDNEIHTFIQHIQIEISGHYGHFDQFVTAEDIQARHFAVNPNQARILCAVSFCIMAVDHGKPLFVMSPVITRTVQTIPQRIQAISSHIREKGLHKQTLFTRNQPLTSAS